MDQAASLRSHPGSALLIDCTDFSVRHVPFDLTAAGLELLVVDTRAHHALTDGQYGSRREQCERAAGLLGVRWLRDIAPGDLDAALARLRDLVDDPEEADAVAAAFAAKDLVAPAFLRALPSGPAERVDG